jgi:hypothetical protein
LSSLPGFSKVLPQILISTPCPPASLNVETTSATGCLPSTARNFHAVASVWQPCQTSSSTSVTNVITLWISRTPNRARIQSAHQPYTRGHFLPCATQPSSRGLETSAT